jgi:carboxyl-terminal processing protease
MNNARAHLLAGACLAVGLVCGATLAPARASPASEPVKPAPTSHSRYRKLDLLARALTTIEQHYVRPVDGERLIHASIRGLVSELDPHSEFLDPREARLLREEIEGAFGGVGMVVGLQRDERGLTYLAVREVIVGGPADRANVAVGERIVAISGRPVGHFVDLREAIMTMRGDPGTRVRFTVVAVDGKTRRTVTVTRERIDPPGVEPRHLGEGLGVLRMRDFPVHAARELRAAIGRLRKEAGDGGLKGVVLDLRDNGGGLLDEAIDVADVFLASARGGEVVDEARAARPGTRSRLPLVVLVNRASASASEVVAGALQDHGRALIVGERTYGKGSVQAPFELGDGSLLKLTIALYYTPHDRLIQASGVTPDVHVKAVPPTPPAAPEVADAGIESERAQPRHLRPEDFGRMPVPPEEETEALRAAGADAQLRAAVQHLQAWDRLKLRHRRRG